MKKLAIALAAVSALALAGCQNSNPKIDAAIAQNLPGICKGAASIHVAFVTVAGADSRISAKAVAKEGAAFAAVKRLCNDPASVNSSNLIIVAAEAYAAAIQAMKNS